MLLDLINKNPFNYKDFAKLHSTTSIYQSCIYGFNLTALTIAILFSDNLLLLHFPLPIISIM